MQVHRNAVCGLWEYRQNLTAFKQSHAPAGMQVHAGTHKTTNIGKGLVLCPSYCLEVVHVARIPSCVSHCSSPGHLLHATLVLTSLYCSEVATDGINASVWCVKYASSGQSAGTSTLVPLRTFFEPALASTQVCAGIQRIATSLLFRMLHMLSKNAWSCVAWMRPGSSLLLLPHSTTLRCAGRYLEQCTGPANAAGAFLWYIKLMRVTHVLQ